MCVQDTHHNDAPLYLTPDQVQQRYGISERLQKSLRQRRLVRFCRPGHRTVLVERASLERYLRSRTMLAIGERN